MSRTSTDYFTRLISHPLSSSKQGKVVLVHSYYLFLSPSNDYQKLTPKEEKDLNAILSKVEDALNNVELFTDQLSSELQQLEYVSKI